MVYRVLFSEGVVYVTEQSEAKKYPKVVEVREATPEDMFRSTDVTCAYQNFNITFGRVYER